MRDRDERGRFVEGHRKTGNYSTPKGARHSPTTEFKKGLVPWNKGKKLSKETRQLISEKVKIAMQKVMQDPEKRQKVLASLALGCYEGHPCYGGEETQFSHGNKHPNYIDGRAGLGYRNEFHRVKKIALSRDGYICQLCHTAAHRLEVHHKDYDKENNTLDNLVTLCRPCHARTNFRREEWKQYFASKEVCYG